VAVEQASSSSTGRSAGALSVIRCVALKGRQSASRPIGLRLQALGLCPIVSPDGQGSEKKIMGSYTLQTYKGSRQSLEVSIEQHRREMA
jgi:hypothetical protein